MRMHGRPITGAVYQKLVHGPAPRRLKPVRQRLIAEGAAEVVHEDFLGHDVHRLVPRRPADLSLFDADELATIDATLDDLEHLVGAQVSELSHDEPWWSPYEEGETVPYHAALLPMRQVVTPAARRAAEEVARRDGIAVEPWRARPRRVGGGADGAGRGHVRIGTVAVRRTRSLQLHRWTSRPRVIDRFRDFDSLPVVGPSVRVATVVDPFSGVVTFTDVLIGPEAVEIADFVSDPDYSTVIDDDPDD
jgi:Antitoxin SocA-like, Panacea domain